MKTKRLFTLLITAVVSISTFAQEKNEGYQFKDLTDIKVTTVKDQQSTGTCWSFSTTSFIEAELLRMNNKVYDLSEMYFVRYAYEEKGQDFVRYHGNNNFGEGGQAHDVMNQIKRYGFITQEAYQGNQYDPGNYRHRELDKILQAILDVIITKPNRKLTTVWFDAYKSVLDAYLGEVPANFNLNGK